jgi:hypothetical protein
MEVVVAQASKLTQESDNNKRRRVGYQRV